MLPQSVARPAFARDEVSREFDDDTQLICEVIAMLVHELPEWVAAAQVLARDGDLQGVARSAHKIAGGVGMVSADPLRAVAHMLEDEARAGVTALVPELCASLEREAGVLVDELCRWSCELECFALMRRPQTH